jgi:MFS family permease
MSYQESPIAPDPTGSGHPEAHVPIPTHRASTKVVVTMAIAQFGLFVALLAPVTVSLALKTQTLFDGDTGAAAVANATVLSVAAFFALVANPVFGRLSDLTTSKLGRRRPWMIIGLIFFVISQLVVALAPSVPVLLAGWCLAQVAGNAILAPLLATIADQVPHQQRGSGSANVGVMQNLGILVAAYIASLFVSNMLALFLVPALIAVVTVGLYCLVLPDQRLAERPDLGGWTALLKTFWVNPLQHADFAWAWISRFLMTLGVFFFITFRLFYLQREIGLTAEDAAQVLTLGVLLYTIALVITAKIGGWLSDRFDRRKIFVISSTVIVAIALTLLGHATTVPAFYVVEIVMGIGYGVYVAVDTALVIDVLPNPDDAAKDLGVLNIANALPQSLAPAIGALILGIGGVAGANYTALFWAAGITVVLGALTIIPIKSVR